MRSFLLAAVFLFPSACVSVAFERPVIKLDNPRSLNEDGLPISYAPGANMLVMGNVKPIVGKQVSVRIYHVNDDGSVRLLTGANTTLHDGEFNINFESPTGGWMAGRLRVEVSLSGMRQVKDSAEVSVVAVGGGKDSVRLPEDSGISLDLDKIRGTVVRIEPDKLFFIRGQFDRDGVAEKLEGPSVSAKIIRDATADLPKVYFGDSGAFSLRKTADKPTFEYEIQVVAPKSTGIFSVRVKPQFVKGEAEMPDFMLDVAEPK